jgi:hypothetical protein
VCAARRGWSNRVDASGVQSWRWHTRSGCVCANRIPRALHRDSGCGQTSGCGAATDRTLRPGAPSNRRRMDRKRRGSAQWAWRATAARYLRSPSRSSTPRRRTHSRSQDRPQLPLGLDREVGRPEGSNKLATDLTRERKSILRRTGLAASIATLFDAQERNTRPLRSQPDAPCPRHGTPLLRMRC